MAEASYDLPAMCQKTFEYLCMKANDSDLVTEKEYKFFNSKIIKPAVKEINENSEIYVTYFGKGRPIDRVVFTVCRKRVIND